MCLVWSPSARIGIVGLKSFSFLTLGLKYARNSSDRMGHANLNWITNNETIWGIHYFSTRINTYSYEFQSILIPTQILFVFEYVEHFPFSIREIQKGETTAFWRAALINWLSPFWNDTFLKQLVDITLTRKKPEKGAKGASGILSPRKIATSLHCYIATLLHRYIATLLHTSLHCYIATRLLHTSKSVQIHHP